MKPINQCIVILLSGIILCLIYFETGNIVIGITSSILGWGNLVLLGYYTYHKNFDED